MLTSTLRKIQNSNPFSNPRIRRISAWFVENIHKKKRKKERKKERVATFDGNPSGIIKIYILAVTVFHLRQILYSPAVPVRKTIYPRHLETNLFDVRGEKKKMKEKKRKEKREEK